MSCCETIKEIEVEISDNDEIVLCLPFSNSNNYLQYGPNPEDLIEVGDDVTYLIYK